jgi:competence ComEA-like helix-hairpin-helix protein
LLNLISASCNSTQIDINSASAEELDNLAGIGKVYAERIILGRPFGSVDDLLKISGIGNKTLEKIKTQGLACVGGGEIAENIPPKKEENTTQGKIPITSRDIEELPEIKTETFNLTPISLNIKSENNKEDLIKNLPLYGIAGFCVLFGAWFLLKLRKKKNEFR